MRNSYASILLQGRGEYELSVLYDGCDIYGSPFKVKVDPAPVCATHSFISGQNYIVVNGNSDAGAKHSAILNLRNAFDEKVGIRSTAVTE